MYKACTTEPASGSRPAPHAFCGVPVAERPDEGWWAGADSAGEPEILKARKMLKKRAEAHLSAVRIVRRIFETPAFVTEREHHAPLEKFYPQLGLLQSPKKITKKVDFGMPSSVKAF